MKTILKLVLFICIFFIGINESNAQSQIRGYYYFSQSYDGNLNEISRRNTSFDYISVSTMQFPGWPVQLVLGGSRYGTYVSLPNSANAFAYVGSSNGWYVFRWYGQEFLVSHDLTRARHAPAPQYGFDEYVLKR